MVVVPPFAQSQHAKDGVVFAVVDILVRLFAPPVTDRIDAPRYMMLDKNANRSAPEKSEKCASPSANQPPTKECRNRESEEDPEKKQAIDTTQKSTLPEIFDVSRQVDGFRREEPTHVSVPESANHTPDGVSVCVGGVRITGFVTMLMMSAMDRQPVDQRTQERPPAHDGENDSDEPIRLE